jgi:hypothetical protein
MSPTPAGWFSTFMARPSATSRWGRSPTKRRFMTAPGSRRRAGRWRGAAQAIDRRPNLLTLMGRPISPAGAGSGSNMTTRSAPTPCSGRAATPRWCASTAPTRARDLDRLHAALLLRRSGRGRQAGDRRTWRNLTAVGARPLATTDCMNFGNPQRPEIMGQFVGCDRRHGRSLPRARFPDRVGQCLALQRNQE